jgi:hypothetical protein
MEYFMDLLSALGQKFLESVLPVLFTAITGLVIAWITKVINDIKSKISDDAEWVIEQAVHAAIYAAEQQNLVGNIQDKKAFALDVATKWLAEKGVKLDLARLDVMIEAAVLQAFPHAESDIVLTSTSSKKNS